MTIVTEILLGITAVVTFLGFRKPSVFERYCFSARRVLVNNEWDRLLTAGFLHGDWMHFAFNAFSFYVFGRNLEFVHGGGPLLIIYLGSIVGGSLVSLFFHRHHDYTSIGASGGVCGAIFATVFLVPGIRITIFPLPIGIPAWLYAIIFLVGSYVGMKRQRDNIGHAAHLGGALCGVLLTLAMFPAIVLAQKYLLLGVWVLGAALVWLLSRDQLISAGTRFSPRASQPVPKVPTRPSDADAEVDYTYSATEVDAILEKISQRGFQSLTPAERAMLERYSRNKVRGR